MQSPEDIDESASERDLVCSFGVLLALRSPSWANLVHIVAVDLGQCFGEVVG